MPLLHFPNELILQISQELSPPDLSSLLSTNRTLSVLLQSPLYESVCRSEELMVKYGGRAMHSAANRGDELAIGKLLEKGVLGRIDKDKFLERVLQSINELALRTLLNGGFDVNMRNTDGKTLLSLAAGGGCTSTREVLLAFRLLLERESVDVNATDSDDRTPLIHAIRRGDVPAVWALLADKRVDVNLASPTGWTALQHAAGVENEEVIGLLLGHEDIVVNPRDDRGHTPLCSAVSSRKEIAVRALLRDPRVDVNLVDNCGQAPLHYAADLGVDGIVRMLLGVVDIDINLQDFSGWTPLCHAAMLGKEKVAQILLEDERVQVNLSSNSDETPLSMAASRGYGEVVKLLLKRPDIEVNSQDQAGRTPLSSAARERSNVVNYEEVVRLLLEDKRTDANLPDTALKTPLHHACENSKARIVKLLLAHPSTNPNAQDSALSTPLSLAARMCRRAGAESTVDVLLSDPRVLVNLKNQDGLTPFHLAVEHAKVPIVRRLISDPRVDVNSRNLTLQTPLHAAAIPTTKAYQCEIIETLLAHPDVDVNARDQSGMTPLSTFLQGISYVTWPIQVERLVGTFLGCRRVDANLLDNQGKGPLYFAVERGGHRKALEMLLKHEGINVGVKDLEGRDLLEVAEAEGSGVAVKQILREYLGREASREEDKRGKEGEEEGEEEVNGESREVVG